MNKVYITSTGYDFWEELENTSEKIDNTSNIISNRITDFIEVQNKDLWIPDIESIHYKNIHVYKNDIYTKPPVIDIDTAYIYYDFTDNSITQNILTNHGTSGSLLNGIIIQSSTNQLTRSLIEASDRVGLGLSGFCYDWDEYNVSQQFDNTACIKLPIEAINPILPSINFTLSFWTKHKNITDSATYPLISLKKDSNSPYFDIVYDNQYIKIIYDKNEIKKYPEQPYGINDIDKIRMSSIQEFVNLPYHAFNHNTTKELSFGPEKYSNGVALNQYFENYAGEYIMIDIGTAIELTQIKLWFLDIYYNFYNKINMPAIFRIYGTNDVSKLSTPSFTGWSLVHDQNTIITHESIPHIYNINTTEKYRIYCLVVNQIYAVVGFDYSDDPTILAFTEWELYGLSSSFESKYNRPLNTNWNNNTISISYTQPTLTIDLYTNGIKQTPVIGGSHNIPLLQLTTGTYGELFYKSPLFLADFRIYDRVISQNEINQIYSPQYLSYKIIDERQLKTTSNELVLYVKEESNVLRTYTNNRTFVSTFNDYYPSTIYVPTPPYFVPAPLPMLEASEALLYLTGSTIENYKTTYQNVGYSGDMLKLFDKTHQILQEHEVHFSESMLSAQLFNEYQNTKTTANTTAIAGQQVEIDAIAKILAGTAFFTGFNTVYSVGQFVKDAINYFSTDSNGKLTEMSTFGEDIWYSFHREPLNNTILENLTSVKINSSNLDATVYNPNGVSKITRVSGTKSKYAYLYSSGATKYNYLDVLKNHFLEKKLLLSRWVYNFTLSFWVLFKQQEASMPFTFLNVFDNTKTFIKVYYSSLSFRFELYDYTGTLLISSTFPFIIVLNQLYHIAYVYDNKFTVKLYINGVLSNTTTLATAVLPNWDSIPINEISLQIRILNQVENIQVEDYRIIPKIVIASDITKLYNVYKPVETTIDITSNVISNRITDTSNVISNRLTDTSNLISNRLTDTSNVISNRLTEISYWNKLNDVYKTIVYDDGNVQIGSVDKKKSIQVYNKMYIMSGSGAGELPSFLLYDSPDHQSEIRLLTTTKNLLISSTANIIINSKDYTGFVGINQFNPQYTLDVAGDINITGNYKLNGVNLDLNKLSVWNKTANNLAIYPDNTITVGIGKTNPNTSYKLDISGNVYVDGKITLTNELNTNSKIVADNITSGSLNITNSITTNTLTTNSLTVSTDLYTTGNLYLQNNIYADNFVGNNITASGNLVLGDYVNKNNTFAYIAWAIDDIMSSSGMIDTAVPWGRTITTNIKAVRMSSISNISTLTSYAHKVYYGSSTNYGKTVIYDSSITLNKYILSCIVYVSDYVIDKVISLWYLKNSTYNDIQYSISLKRTSATKIKLVIYNIAKYIEFEFNLSDINYLNYKPVFYSVMVNTSSTRCFVNGLEKVATYTSPDYNATTHITSIENGIHIGYTTQQDHFYVGDIILQLGTDGTMDGSLITNLYNYLCVIYNLNNTNETKVYKKIITPHVDTDFLTIGGRPFYNLPVNSTSTFRRDLTSDSPLTYLPIDVSDSGKIEWYVENVLVNSVPSLVNTLGGTGGYVYYSDGLLTTTPQVKNISYNELIDKPTIYNKTEIDTETLNTSNWIKEVSNNNYWTSNIDNIQYKNIKIYDKEIYISSNIIIPVIVDTNTYLYYDFTDDPTSSTSLTNKGTTGTSLNGIIVNALSSIQLTTYPVFDNHTTNLSVWYKFDGNYNDSSINGYNLTTFGNPTITNRIIYITQPKYAQLPINIIDFTNDITICLWYRFDNNSTYPRLFDFSKVFAGSNHLNSIKIGRSNASTSLEFVIDNNSLVLDFGHTTGGNFIHISWVIKKTGQWIIYKNGEQNNLSSKVYPTTNTYTYSYLGKSNWSSVEFNKDYQVSLKDFRIYNRTLTPNEIKKVYGYTLTKTSIPLLENTGLSLSSSAFYWNGSLTNSGDNAYISLPKAVIDPIITATNFSISFWSKFESITNTFSVLNLKQNTTSSYIDIVSQNGNIKVVINGLYESLFTLTSSINTWYHNVITLSYNSPILTVNLYTNGVKKTATTGGTFNVSSFSFPTDALANGRIGDNGTLTDPSPSYLADFKLFNRTLTQTEINQLYSPLIPIPAESVIEVLTKLTDEKELSNTSNQIMRNIQNTSNWITDIETQVNGITPFSGNYNDLIGIPSTFPPNIHTHSYTTLTDLPLVYTQTETNNLLNAKSDTNHNHSYSSLTGIPNTFAPSAHTHLWADITDKPIKFSPLAHMHLWADIIDKPIKFAPLAHMHLWADIIDKPLLYTKTETDSLLNGKSDTNHTHAYSSLTGIPSTFPPNIHTHSYTTLTDLPLVYTQTETNNLLNAKSDTTHNHSYTTLTDLPLVYTQTETNNLLNAKSDTTHNHSYTTLTDLPLVYTKTETDSLLNGKSDTTHTHAYSSLTGIPTVFLTDWNSKILNKPTLFDGTWSSLSGKPTSLMFLDATSSIQMQLNGKQATLTQGTGISIVNNVISSTTSSQWTTSGLNVYYNSGNVGIGNTNPTCKLSINQEDIGLYYGYDHTEAPLLLTHNAIPTSLTTLNDPKSILHLVRQGTVGQCWSSRASFKLCRWENNANRSRTRLDINLSHHDYDDINIVSFRSDGRVGIGTTNPIEALEVNGTIKATLFSGSGASLTSLNANNITGILPVSQGGTGTNTLAVNKLLLGNGTGALLSANLTWDNLNNKLGISNTNPTCKLSINEEEPSLYLGYDHTEAPLLLTHNAIPTSITILNDPKSILHLVRQGTPFQCFSSRASFKLCRWENNTNKSRTRLDINLSHQDYDDINIVSFRSDGRVGIGTTNPIEALEVNGTIKATLFSGSGASLTSLNANNITGILPVSQGGTGTNTLAVNKLLLGNGTGALLSANLTWDNLNNKLGISNTNPTCKLSINEEEPSLYLGYDHTEAPLLLTHNAIPTSITILNDPKSILHLVRQGTPFQCFSSRASFKLCRWENNTNKSRTRLDINLSHQDYDDINIVSFRSDGRVGIGTTNPAYQLDVLNDINYTGILRKNGIDILATKQNIINLAANKALLSDASGNVAVSTVSNTELGYLSGVSSSIQTQLSGKSDTTHTHAYSSLTGIPTTFAPSPHFHLWADITDKPTTFAPSTHTHAYSSLTGIPTTFAPSPHFHLWADITDKPTTLTYLDATSSIQTQLNGKQATLTAGTNISIVGNTISATASGSSQWITSGLNIYYNSGNVGIGLTNPSYKLDVISVSDATYIATFRHPNLTQGIGIAYDSLVAMGANATQNINLVSKSTGNINFITNGSTRMTVAGSGNVGIGKTPSYKLDVNGDINITNGTLRVNGVDLLVPTGLTNQHYLYQTEFYLNGYWLYDMAINLSALAGFGDNTSRIYELHISGKSGDYGDVNVPMASFLIYHSNYAGGKYMYNTLITPRGIQGAPDYLVFVGGNIVRFTTKNYNIASVYTKVILKSS